MMLNVAFTLVIVLGAVMLYRIYQRRGPVPWREALMYAAIGTIAVAAALGGGALTRQAAPRVLPIVLFCVSFPFLAVQLSTTDFVRSRHCTVSRLMWLASGVLLLALFAAPIIATIAACLAGFDCF